MANVDISKQEDPKKKTADEAASKKSKKKYEQSLAYERAFLKKKEQLENASRVRQLQADLVRIQQVATAEMATNAALLGDSDAADKAMNQIKLKMVQDLSKKQLELLSERQQAEYKAHEFASACAMKSFETQGVHERARTALALAEAQKVQTEKLKTVKEAEIAELQSQYKVAASSGEKRKITLEIKKLQKEISDAEAAEASYKEQSVKYAEIVKKVEFERLSASEKLAAKEKEISDLQAEADNAVAEIDSKIVAKQLDLEAATDAGNTELAASLRQEIADLRSTRDTTASEYKSSIDTLKQALDGAGGLKEQARKETGAAVVTPQFTGEDGWAEQASSGSNSVSSQIDSILNYLSELVSVFHTYVDTIESKVAPEAITSSVVPSGVAQVPTENTKPDAQPIVEHLRALVTQTTSDDAELQAELSARLDAIANIMATSSGDFSGANPEDLKQLVATIQEHFENAEKKDSKGKKKSDKDSEGQQLSREDLREARKENWKSLKETAKDNVNSEIDAEKDAAHSRTVESMEKMYAMKRAAFTEEGRKEALAKGLQNLADKMDEMSKKIDDNINNFYAYQADIDARLQGSQDDFKGVINTMTTKIGMSAVIKQEEFIKKFKELVDAGITYNLESRTLLATVTDKVISTFDVLSADLQRLIRIQQADTTAARMGIESSINKLLNSMYSDSSYLSSSAHDNITSSILQASAMLSRDMSVEFEYAVHKWLGSLYSLGVSETTLNKIAQGLDYLGTGNVTALNNDDSLQTLLAMSANYGGIPYADILTQGLNAENTNKLLSGMLKYLMAIANNTDSSQVTKSAYTDIFGLEMADLRAITNITETDIESLNKLNLNYESAVKETQTQIDSIIKRTHFSQMVDVLFENALLGASLDIGGNPVAYGMWKTLNAVEGLTGGIALPFVNIFGSGFDLNTTVTGLLKGGMAGLALLGNLVTSLGGGGFDGALNLQNDWEMTEFTSRGSVNDFLTTGTTSGFSTSSRIDYNGSGSGSDMKRTEMSDSADSANEDSEVINKNVQDAQEIPEKIYEQTQLIWGALADKDNTLLKQSVATHQLLEERLQFGALTSISDLLSPSRLFLTSNTDRSGVTGALYVDSESGVVSVNKNTYQEYTTSLSNVTKSLETAISRATASSDIQLSTSMDIWSLIQQISTSDLSKSTSYTDLVNSSYGSELLNISNEQKKVNTILLEQVASAVQADTTTKLAEDLKTVAEVQALNKVVFPEYVRATIDDYSPASQKFLKELLKAAIELNLNGGSSSSDVDPEDHPIVRQLASKFKDMFDNNIVVKTTSTDTFYGSTP